MPDAVRTTCPYCGVGCGIMARSPDTVAGDAAHPANAGRLCSKGSALGETFGLDGRLLEPLIEGRPATWTEALDLVARRLAETAARHGPDSVAFYVSGQLLTEDYYVANKLMKGFIGSGNIDTNSRLCMASSVAGHRRAFGEDLVPGCYEDLEEADLVVLVGSNAAWCHPILFRRLIDARQRRGTRLVVVDPRRTATAAEADLHLGLSSGTDVLLFNGLLARLHASGATDPIFIAARTSGFAAALDLAQADAPSAAAVARGCGLPEAEVETFFEWFAATPRTVTVYSQGVNQSAHGTDKVNAIINCHLATGRIGRPGAGPFSLTGQPNAMGGREVGGLANQLAAHMSFEDGRAVERVARFWSARRMTTRPGLKAVEMFEAVGDGRIKALWIMGTNPAVSLPDANRVREALRSCPFTVVSDCTPDTDTASYADVLLPAAGWSEKDGTVTNSERRISRQRAFRPLPGEARPDWWIVTQVARRMGFGAEFPYARPAGIFREHAALSAFENDGERVFDIGGLADLTDAEYDALEPIQWPVPPGQRTGTARLLGDGRHPTTDGRARFVPVRQEGPVHAVSPERPLVLNTGRLRDQWHTMTRTGGVPRLMTHAPEPAVDLHPADAASRAVGDGDLVRLSSRWGGAVVRARVSADQPQGTAFLPMHWSDRLTARGSSGRLANPAVDAWSGQPELKHTPVSVEPVAVQWEGFLISRRLFRPTGFVYWARTAVPGGHVYALAGPEPASQGVLLGRRLVERARERIEFTDLRRGLYRAAVLDRDDTLIDCLYVAPVRALPNSAWLRGLLAERKPLDADERRALLSGRAPVAMPEEGRIVCACFGVGANRIERAIREHGLVDTAALGRLLNCGTNCGSCLPELRELLSRERPVAAE
ncbi:MAG TPA: molybdopterin-dependent oxidoreductase [Microvirga sp.]|nr:molybdopterin-dependent oxidoreductase [Microvirga sp.]